MADNASIAIGLRCFAPIVKAAIAVRQTVRYSTCQMTHPNRCGSQYLTSAGMANNPAAIRANHDNRSRPLFLSERKRAIPAVSNNHDRIAQATAGVRAKYKEDKWSKIAITKVNPNIGLKF